MSQEDPKPLNQQEKLNKALKEAREFIDQNYKPTVPPEEIQQRADGIVSLWVKYNPNIKLNRYLPQVIEQEINISNYSASKYGFGNPHLPESVIVNRLAVIRNLHNRLPEVESPFDIIEELNLLLRVELKESTLEPAIQDNQPPRNDKDEEQDEQDAPQSNPHILNAETLLQFIDDIWANDPMSEAIDDFANNPPKPGLIQ